MYPPHEDSFIMAEEIEKINSNKINKALDIGTGTGILAFTLSKKIGHIDATDIDKNALAFVKEEINKRNIKNINVFYSNLFDNVKDKYDLIVFNPPYLPHSNPNLKSNSRPNLEFDTFGGRKGNEIIKKFLQKAKNFLNDDGKILFCFSSLSKKEEIEKALKKFGYVFNILRKEKFFFEEFYVILAESKKAKKFENVIK